MIFVRLSPVFCVFKTFLVVLMIAGCGYELDAQTEINSDIRDVIRSLVEDYIESTGEENELDFNTLTEDLYRVFQSPYNLNQVTRQQLADLIILSDSEINSILSYRESLGPFMSIYELQAIPGLSPDKVNVMRYLFTVSEQNTSSTAAIIEEQSLQYFVKWRRSIQQQAGFKENSSGEVPFRGDQNYLYQRLAYQKENIRWGMIIEKDQGERWSSANSLTGLDYLSAHYEISQPNSWINQVNLGDYTVNLGQGLIASNGFGLGKTSFSTNVKRGGRPMRAYTSVAENLNFRGAAMDMRVATRINTLAFVSYDKRDANIVVDDQGENVFTTLQLSGQHRTASEREDHDAITERIVGGNIRYNSDHINVGFNTIHHAFSLPREVSPTPFRLYNWEGDRLSNYSVDYGVLVGGWNLYGEAAYSSNGGWAQQHGLLKTLDPKLDVSVVFRDYQPQYQAIYANSFGESNLTTNEKGLYFGWEYRPSKNWKMRGYADFWSNPWLRSRVDGSGAGSEYLLRIDYRERDKRNYYVLWRYEVKDLNAQSPSIIDRPVATSIQRLRLHATHNVSTSIELRTRIEGAFFEKEDRAERGILLYQDVLYRAVDAPLSINARFSYFNASDFDARLFAYENDLLYEYYVPSFWGEGLRYYLHARYEWSYNLMTEVRLEQTNFYGQSTISSGLNQIEGSTSARIKAQIRYRF